MGASVIELEAQAMAQQLGAIGRFRLMTPGELAKLPPARWLVRDVLPENGIASIYGPSASGKSFLAIDLLAHVANGLPWFGKRVIQAPCVYVALEGGNGIAQRIKAWQVHNGQLPDRFRVIVSSLDIRKPSDLQELVESIRESGFRGGVVCIDTLAQAAPGLEENNSSDMGEVINAAQYLQRQLGGVVLLIHHTGKDSSKGARGHSSFYAALDAAICVNVSGTERTWTTESSEGGKSKDGAGATRPFQLSMVDIGEDDEGEPETSCVIRQPEGQMRQRGPKPPTGANQKAAFAELSRLLREAGAVPPDGAPESLPPGRPCIAIDQAIDPIASRMPTADPKHRKERAKEAITGLAGKGNIVCMDGFLWLP